MTNLDDDAPMTLDEAAEVLLRGAVTAATLRAAIGRRDLTCERIGRHVMVTPAEVRAWRKRCRVPAEDRPIGADARERISTAPISSGHIEAQRALTRSTLAKLAKMRPARKRRQR